MAPKQQLITEFVLVTTIAGRSKYISHLTTRDWDKRKLIQTTDDITKAKTWPTEKEALDVLSKCIVNDRQYHAEPYQYMAAPEKKPNFSDNAKKAMI